jgi:hypothetical protein
MIRRPSGSVAEQPVKNVDEEFCSPWSSMPAAGGGLGSTGSRLLTGAESIRDDPLPLLKPKVVEANSPSGVKASPTEIRFFATPDHFRKWLKVHHGDTNELWVGFYKKASDRPSITWPEAVDEASVWDGSTGAEDDR